MNKKSVLVLHRTIRKKTMYIQDNELERILKALKSISPEPLMPGIPVNSEYQLGLYIGAVNVVIQHLEDLIEKK